MSKEKNARFKAIINAYLDKRAAEDPLFAKSYANEKKSIDDCVAYIISTVKAEGGCAYTDDEVYGMAVHYYDEENLKFDRGVNCTVVDNHALPLSDDERAEARARALKRYEDAEFERIKSERMASNAAKRQTKKEAETKSKYAKADTKPKEAPKPEQKGLFEQLELF